MDDLKNRNVASELQPKHLEAGQGFKAKWKNKPSQWRHKAIAAMVVALAVVMTVPLYAIANLVPGEADFISAGTSLSSDKADLSTHVEMTTQEQEISIKYHIYDAEAIADAQDDYGPIPTIPIGDAIKEKYGMGTQYAESEEYKTPYETTIDTDDYESYSGFFEKPKWRVIGYAFRQFWYDVDSVREFEATDDALYGESSDLELTASWEPIGYSVELVDNLNTLSIVKDKKWDDTINWDEDVKPNSDYKDAEKGLEENANVSAWVDTSKGYVWDKTEVLLGKIINPTNSSDADLLSKLDPRSSGDTITLNPAYIVTVNANGGVDGDGNSIAESTIYAVKGSEKFSVAAPGEAAHGTNGTLKFSGWQLNEDTSKLYAEDELVPVTANATLTAVWEGESGNGATIVYTTSNADYGKVKFSTEQDSEAAATKTDSIADKTAANTAQTAAAVSADGYKLIKWQHKGTGESFVDFDPTQEGDTYTPTQSGGSYASDEVQAVFGFDVTVDPNGGTLKDGKNPGSTDNTSAVSGLKLPTADDFTKVPEDKMLTGWSDGDENSYNPGDTVTSITKGTTFKAQWADAATIEYTSSNTSFGKVKLGSEADKDAAQTRTETVAATGPVDGAKVVLENGYEVLGWQVKDGSDWKDIAGSAGQTTFTPSKVSDAYVSAEYQVVLGYNVILDKNDGSGTKDTTSYASQTGASTTVTFPSWTRDGYKLVGWSTSSTAKATDTLITTSTTTATSSTTYYAIWDQEYTINYAVAPSDDIMGTVKVGSSGTPGSTASETVDSTTSIQGATAAVSDSDKYEFAGWTTGKTLADGGSVIGSNLTYTPTTKSNTTYYANFKHKTANVTYKPGDHGNFSDVTIVTNIGDNTPAYNGPTVSVSDKNPKGAAGYTFKAWDPVPNTSTAVTADEAYTATWDAKTGFMVNYSYPDLTSDEISALGLPASQTSLTWEDKALNNAAAALLTTSPDGYTFGGWYADSSYTKAVTASSTYGDVAGNDDITDNKTVYGKFTAKDVSITFHPNYGTETTKEQAAKTGKSTTLAANTFTRTGYAFDGWATTADGNKAYDDKASYTPKASGNDLYAKWTANKYTIVYNANGGTGTMASEERAYDAEAAALAKNTFTREGYRFTGWKAGSTEYSDEQVVNNLAASGTVTLYAQWETSYDISYDLQGGAAAQDVASKYEAVKVGSGKNYTVETFDPAKVTKTGYTMTGWNTYANGRGTAYRGGETITNVSQGYTFYAQWQANATKYNVKRYVETDSGYVLKDTLEKTVYNANNVYTGSYIAAEASDTPEGYVRNDSADVGSGDAIVASVESAGDADNPSTLVLYFDRQSFDVEYVYAGDMPAGNPPAKASYKYGATVNVASQPSDVTGYKFVPATTGVKANGWSISGLDSITGTSFDMPAGKVTLTGTWELDEFTVHYSAGDHGSVASTSETVKYQKSPKGVTATADSGYYPTGWDQVNAEGTVIKADVDPTSYTVTDNTLYFKAKFGETVAYTYKPGAHPDPSFTEVGEEKLQVNDPVKTLQQLVTAGKLNANAVDAEGNPKAAAGYKFTGWKVTNSVNDTVTSEIPATLSASYTFEAQYEALPYTITIAGDADTTVSASGYTQSGNNWVKSDVTTDSSVTLPDGEGISKPGYSLDGWTVTYTLNGEQSKSYGSTATFNMPAANITATPSWTPDSVTVTYTTDDQGTITKNSETLTAATNEADVVGSTASPKDGYDFKAWVVTSGTDTKTDLTKAELKPVKQDDGSYHAVTYKATYTAKKYALTVRTEDAEKGTASASSEIQVAYGESMTAADVAKITVTPASNYKRASVQWTYTRYGVDGATVLEKDKPLSSDDQLRSIEFSGPVTITAKFAGKDMTVSYESNQGTGGYPEQTVAYGGSVTLPDGKDLSRTGYTFVGWDAGSVKSGATAEYPVKEGKDLPEYTPTADETTMYAHWNANTYSITYNANGYEITVPDAQEFTYGTSTATLSSTKPAISDASLEFAGWDTNATKDGTRYAAGSAYPKEGSLPADNVTLYAVYTTKQVQVKYEPGTYGFDNTPVSGGSTASQDLDYGAREFTVAENGFTTGESNYEFDQWLGSDGKYYAANETVRFAEGLTEDFTLTAQWKPKANARVYTLNYLKTDGTVDVPRQVNLEDSGFDAQAPNETAPAHKAFSHWAVNSNAATAAVASTDKYADLYAAHGDVVAPQSLNLYPHYKLTDYTVKYDGNQQALGSVTTVSGTVEDQPFTFGGAAGTSLRSNGFVAPGYTFVGWDADEKSDSADYEADDLVLSGDPVNAEGDDELTLYAIWEANSYTVVYHETNSTAVLDGSNMDVTWGAKLPAPSSQPTNENNAMVLTGWSLEQDGSGTPYRDGSDTFGTVAVADFGQAGSNLSDPETLDLYPVWTLSDNAYTVTFNKGEGEGDLSATSLIGVEGGTAKVIDNTLTRTGYTANGWKTANGTPVADGSTWTFGTSGDDPAAKSQTLTADFTQNHYTISYNANGGENAQGTVDKTDAVWDGTGLLSGLGGEPTRAGYTFGGWYTTATGGSQVTDASKYNTTDVPTAVDSDGATVTLYAHWTVKSAGYSLGVNLGSGTYDNNSSFAPVSAGWDSPVLETLNLDTGKLALDGFTADTTLYADAEYTTPVTASTKYSDLTGGEEQTSAVVYVKWNEQDATITYEVSDPAHASITSPTGGTTTVKKSTGLLAAAGTVGLIADGYHMSGWYDKSDSNKEILAGGDTYTPTKPDSLWENKTYVALIEPDATTAYKTEHYQQNLDNDEYTLFETVDGTGTTGESVTAANKSYTGFTYDSSVDGTVASGQITGDGNFTMKLYYPRVTRNVTYAWSWTGDSEPASKPSLPDGVTGAKFGSAQTTGAAPSIDGWTFNGWTPSVESLGASIDAEIGFTMPASNVVLTADMRRTTYAVKFAIDDDYTEFATITGGPVDVPSGTTVSASAYSVEPIQGYSVTGWKVVYDDPSKDDAETTAPEAYAVDAPLTFKAQLSSKLTVSYAANGHGDFATESNKTTFTDIDPGTTFGSAYYFAGDTDDDGLPKAKAGWKFIGWEWTQGGTTKDNKTYTGNLVSGGLDALVGTINASITFNAQWEATAQKLTIDPDGGTWDESYAGVDGSSVAVAKTTNSAVASVKTEAGYEVPGRDDVSKAGYTLKEWRDSANNVVALGTSFTMTGTDNTLTAVWEPNMATVTYKRNVDAMGTLSKYTETLQERDNATIEGSTPTAANDGYEFVGWTVEKSSAEGGSAPTSAQATVDGSTHKLTPLEPIADKTVFVANFRALPQNVTFESNDANGTVTDGRASDAKTALYNGKVLNFTDITATPKAGYKAASPAWSYTMEVIGGETVTDKTDDPANVTILGPTTFKALWAEKDSYKVVYSVDGGTSVAAKDGVKWTDKGLVSATTTKVGYTFGGWYTDEELTKPVSSIGADPAFSELAYGEEPAGGTVTLYAKWNPKSGYSVSYDTNGGSNVTPVSPRTGSANLLTGVTWTTSGLDSAMGEPTKAGFDFDAWYADKDLTPAKKVVSGTTYADLAGTNDDTSNVPVLYAGYTTKHYALKYNSAGGSAVADQDVTWSDGITFKDGPTRSGYVFDGWYYGAGAGTKVVDGETTFAQIVNNNESATEGTVTAHWKKEVTYSVYHHKWVHAESASEANVFEHPSGSGLYWRDYTGEAVTYNGVEDDEITADMIVAKFAGFAQFDQTEDMTSYANASGSSNLNIGPAQKLTGTLSASGANRFDVYYKEQKDFRVVYDFNLSDDTGHKPLDENGDAIEKPADKVTQWWSSDGFYSPIQDLIEVDSRPGYDFLGWFADESDVEAESDSQTFYQLAGYSNIIDADNEEPDEKTVTVKASWKEQTAETNYILNSEDEGKGEVILHVDGEVADSADEELSEDVLRFHGNSTMGATASPKDGYHFVSWLVNRDLTGSLPLATQSVTMRTAGGDMAAMEVSLSTQADDDTWYLYSTNASINPAKDAGDDLYPDGVTYMATFAQSDYTIAYDANYDGAPAIGTTTPASWDEAGLLGSVAEPTREHYTFAGWWTAPDGGKQVTSESKYNETDLAGATALVGGQEVALDTHGAIVTLYAHWTPIRTEDELQKLYDDTKGLPDDGTKVSADGTDVDPGDKWVPESVKKELEDALAAAKAVLDDPNATGDDVYEAYERLAAASKAYEDAKKAGTKVATAGDKSDTTKGDTVRPAAKSGAPTTGDHVADAMIVIGGVALVAAFVLVLAARRRERQ